MSRLTWFAAVLAAFAAVPVSGQTSYRVIYPQEDQKVADALEAPARPSYEGDLQEVLQEIAEEHGIRVVIDRHAAKAAGLNLDDNLDFDVDSLDRAEAEQRGMRFVGDVLDVKSVLRRFLDPYKMKYVIEYGVVRVMPDEAAEQRTVVRAYDVAALLDERTTVADLAEGVSTLASGLNRRSMSPFPPASNSPYAEYPPIKAVPYKTTLVVSGSPSDHDRVERALAMLDRI